METNTSGSSTRAVNWDREVCRSSREKNRIESGMMRENKSVPFSHLRLRFYQCMDALESSKYLLPGFDILYLHQILS